MAGLIHIGTTSSKLLLHRNPFSNNNSNNSSSSASSMRFCFRRKSNNKKITLIRAKIREIFMPALSSTMTEGKIVSWMKSEGDKLNKGESVVVVESDKADMDVETFYDGYLAAIMVEEGGVAAVGSAIALLVESTQSKTYNPFKN